jgi:DNA-binding response OmpR family regulator
MAKKILIIEDEDVLLDILRKKIESQNFKVLIARDGEEGLNSIKNLKPDLVLLDMVMPKVTGYDVLKTLKDNKIKLPVIIISNSGQPVDVEKAMALGACDYMVKAELDPDEIIKKIKACLGEENKSSNATAIGQAGKKQRSKAEKRSKGKIILVAEDDMFLRELCSKKMVKMGYDVEEAVDGLVAFEKIKNNKPDLVLLDVIMPGMEGFEILKKVRSHSDKKIASTPIVVLSNLGQEDDVKKGLELGANDYLVKANHTMEEIVNRIKKYL